LNPHKNLLKSDLLKEFSQRSLFKGRQTKKNDNIKKKYIPLLQNLGLLLDNLLNHEPSQYYEISKIKQKRHKYEPETNHRQIWKSATAADTRTGESRTNKKAVIFTRHQPTETPTFPSKAFVSSLGKYSHQGQIKNIPVLFPRNSGSDWRDGDRYGKRNCSTLHGNFQGDITRNIRDHKYVSRNQKQYSTTSHGKIANSPSRDSASGDEYRRRSNRRYALSNNRTSIVEGKENKKSSGVHDRITYEDYTKNYKLKNGGDETKRQNILPKYVRRVGRVVSGNKEHDITEQIPSKTISQNSLQNVTHSDANNKQIVIRRGANSPKTQRIDSIQEMISIEELSNVNLALRKIKNTRPSAVSIIDGYSTTRNKNS
jgi:hypothetical protein